MFQKHKPMCGHHDGQAALSWVPVMPSGARLGSLLSGTLNLPAPLSHPIPSEGLSWGASMPTSPPVSRPRALVSTQGYMCSQHRRPQEVLTLQIRACVETQLIWGSKQP